MKENGIPKLSTFVPLDAIVEGYIDTIVVDRITGNAYKTVEPYYEPEEFEGGDDDFEAFDEYAERNLAFDRLSVFEKMLEPIADCAVFNYKWQSMMVSDRNRWVDDPYLIVPVDEGCAAISTENYDGVFTDTKIIERDDYAGEYDSSYFSNFDGGITAINDAVYCFELPDRNFNVAMEELGFSRKDENDPAIRHKRWIARNQRWLRGTLDEVDELIEDRRRKEAHERATSYVFSVLEATTGADDRRFDDDILTKCAFALQDGNEKEADRWICDALFEIGGLYERYDLLEDRAHSVVASILAKPGNAYGSSAYAEAKKKEDHFRQRKAFYKDYKSKGFNLLLNEMTDPTPYGNEEEDGRGE